MTIIVWGIIACSSSKEVLGSTSSIQEPVRWQQEYDGKPNILVDKSEQKIYLIRQGKMVLREGKPISWTISLGQEPKGHKLQEGDQRTPEGLYRYTDYSSSSRYHGSLLIHYPNTIDAEKAWNEGRIKKSIYSDITRNIKKGLSPPMQTDLGGYILVHGTHKKGERFPDNVRYSYTDGCVGMSNNTIDELRELLVEDKAEQDGKILIIP